MPQATDEKVVQVEGFDGLNLRDARNAIGEKELSDAVNVNLGNKGQLEKRTGFKTLGNFADTVKLLGFLNSDSRQEFIAGFFDPGTSTWRLSTSTDGVAWTDRGAFTGTPHHGVQYVDKFYIICTGGTTGLHQWDGTLTQIAGAPEGTHCHVFKDRLFVSNSLGSGAVASRIYYSKPFDFSSTGWPATNYNSVGEGDGTVLIAARNVQDTMLLFKTGSIYTLYVQGDTTLWILRPFKSELGSIGKDSIVLYEGVLYFCSAQGVYQTDGNTVRNISEQIAPAFKDVVVSSVTINRASAFVWNDMYVLSMEVFPVLPTWNSWAGLTWNELATVPWSGSGAVYQVLVYHIRPKGWTKWLPVGVTPHGFVTVSLTATLRGVYSASRTSPGKIYKFGETRYQDDSTDYEIAAETKEFEFGAPTEFKRGKWLGVALRGAGQHSMYHVVDGSSKPAVSLTAVQENLEHKVVGPEYFRSWRFRVTGTHANPVSIFGFHLHLSRRRHMAASRG